MKKAFKFIQANTEKGLYTNSKNMQKFKFRSRLYKIKVNTEANSYLVISASKFSLNKLYASRLLYMYRLTVVRSRSIDF